MSLLSAFTKLQKKVDFLEKQFKRNNIIIYGMEEPSSESFIKPLTEDICEKLSEKLGLDISKDDLDSAHRLGKTSNPATDSGVNRLPHDHANRSDTKSCPVLVKFCNQQLRDKI